jgi:hypothetical protein
MLVDQIIEKIEKASGKLIPDIETIQDKVEEVLIKN